MECIISCCSGNRADEIGLPEINTKDGISRIKLNTLEDLMRVLKRSYELDPAFGGIFITQGSEPEIMIRDFYLE